MARGKRAHAAAAPKPVKGRLRHYICEACHRHHGAFTKIGIQHRQYDRKES